MNLVEKVAELHRLDFEARCDAVENAWGDDPEKLEMLGRATEVIKTAEAEGEFGELGLTDSQFITLAAELVTEALEGGVEKEAEEAVAEPEVEAEADTDVEASADDEDEIEEEVEKLAAYYELSYQAAEILKEAGVTTDDLDRIDSEEEAEELGRFLAHYVLERAQQDSE